MVVVVYDSNNSGGSWWLTYDNWLALEEAGWNVHWIQPKGGSSFPGPGRSLETYDNPLQPQTRHDESINWLGCRAESAAKEFETPEEGIKEWEKVTGQNAGAYGCSCCGPPHNFEYTDEDGNKHYASARIVETDISFD
jgi:hypothetical protein